MPRWVVGRGKGVAQTNGSWILDVEASFAVRRRLRVHHTTRTVYVPQSCRRKVRITKLVIRVVVVIEG